MKTKILRNYIEKHLTFKVGIGGFSSSNGTAKLQF